MPYTVDLLYFKPSGKYYSEGSYTSDRESPYEVLLEAQERIEKGDNEGLIDNAVKRNGFIVLVNGPELVPTLLLNWTAPGELIECHRARNRSYIKL